MTLQEMEPAERIAYHKHIDMMCKMHAKGMFDIYCQKHEEIMKNNPNITYVELNKKMFKTT